MTSKSLPEKNLLVINKYLSFFIGSSVCSIPYYNNRHQKARAKLRAQIGKGSPKDIFDEVESLSLAEKVNVNSVDSATLKKFLVDHNIGIDCSGFVYHVLEPKSLVFPFSKGFIGSLRAKFRPAENAGVTTFVDNQNSREISIKNIESGDIITMVGNTENGERDHILLIHQVDYNDALPTKIHYTHAVAWPSDGEYGHGVRQGIIQIIDSEKPLTEQLWIEAEKTGEENYTHTRALKSVTQIRRLNWL